MHSAICLVFLITGRNEVVAKVIFLQASVCPQWGCLPQCIMGYHPPGPDTPQGPDTPGLSTPPGLSTSPGTKYTPGLSTPPGLSSPFGTKYTSLGLSTPQFLGGIFLFDFFLLLPGSRLRDTVNERPVSILLECILVSF